MKDKIVYFCYNNVINRIVILKNPYTYLGTEGNSTYTSLVEFQESWLSFLLHAGQYKLQKQPNQSILTLADQIFCLASQQ